MLCQVYLVTNYCALQNLTARKVIIIHPYVYRLYWYLEAYNVTSFIAFCNTLVVEWISACPLHHEQPCSNPGTTGHLSFFPATVSYKTLTHSRLHCRDREKK